MFKLSSNSKNCNQDNKEFIIRKFLNTPVENFSLSKPLYLQKSNKYVVFWEEPQEQFKDIYATIFDSCFKNLTNVFRVHNQYTNYQTRMSSAELSNGNFVVAWDSYDEKDAWIIFFTIFDHNGNKLLPDKQVNNPLISFSSVHPNVIALNEIFIISWHSGNSNLIQSNPCDLNINTNGAFGCEVYIKSYTQNGIPIQSQELLVNTHTNFNQWFSQMSPLENGRFAVAWISGHRFGYDQICVQVFDSNFNKKGDETLVSSINNQRQTIWWGAQAITDFGNNLMAIVYNYDDNKYSNAQIAIVNYDTNAVMYFFSVYSNADSTPYQVSIMKLSEKSQYTT